MRDDNPWLQEFCRYTKIETRLSSIKNRGENMGNATLSKEGLFHLCIVYVVWSSTYLAIRIAVNPEGGFPPFAMGVIRMAPAALILLSLAYFQGKTIKPSSDDMLTLCITGILLWASGNGVVMWAEQFIDSGFACLILSSSPIWSTIIELIVFKRRTSLLLMASLLLGFLGILVLTIPSFLNGISSDLVATTALIFAAASWGLGSVLQSRRPMNLSPQVASGYQHLFASVGFLAASILSGEVLSQPTMQAWLAWGYLVVFGSVFAFTSYIVTLKLLPISIAMTYAYVNPVLALGLGWLLLDEQITWWTIAGASLVIISVAGIFADKRRPESTQVVSANSVGT